MQSAKLETSSSSNSVIPSARLRQPRAADASTRDNRALKGSDVTVTDWTDTVRLERSTVSELAAMTADQLL